MKTFNELIQQLIEMRKDERNGKIYRKRNTASHICDKDQLMLDGEFTTAVLPDLDSVLNMSHQIYRDNWYNERRKECTLDYFIVKTFLEADTDKKEEMLKDSRICDCLLCARKCFNRFIPCKWWKRIVDNAKEKRSFLDRLQLVEDFDNPTDEEIIHCLALSGKIYQCSL